MDQLTASIERPNTNNTADRQRPYFIGLGRAMVSLGPISKSRYCSYRCKFCYVQGPFPKYAAATPVEILQWLKERRSKFDIVYVSGDTDSFAAPRAPQAITLLEQLLELQIDVLFTTRAVLKEEDRARLFSLAEEYRRRGLLLIACVSISQLHHPEIEPRPIAAPAERIEFLASLRAAGLTTALTVRPFIPAISADEYRQIASAGYRQADIVLGGNLYLDKSGLVESALNQAVPSSADTPFHSDTPLDFSLNEDDWELVEHPEAEHALRTFCSEVGVPFFMRSAHGVDWLRTRRADLTGRVNTMR